MERRSAVDIYTAADDTAHGNADDEKHGIVALGEIRDCGVQADGKARKAKAVVQDTLVFLLYTGMKNGAGYRAGNDGGCVDYCS